MLIKIKKWLQKRVFKKRDIGINPFSIRGRMLSLEATMRKMPDALEGDSACPLRHRFGDSCYIREITMPKGMLIVSRLHKITHPYFVLKGDVSVLTEGGVVRIKAPYSGITNAGTKRVLYIHEDTVWTTVHVTKHRNLEKIENQIIAKDYKNLPRQVRKQLDDNIEKINDDRLLEFTNNIKEGII